MVGRLDWWELVKVKAGEGLVKAGEGSAFTLKTSLLLGFLRKIASGEGGEGKNRVLVGSYIYLFFERFTLNRSIPPFCLHPLHHGAFCPKSPMKTHFSG